MNAKHINVVRSRDLIAAEIEKYLPDKIMTLCDLNSWERRKIIHLNIVLALIWRIFWT